MSGTLYVPSAHLRISMIFFRFLLLAVALLSLGGCSLFGDDYSDLSPGTFRFRADGTDYSGDATLETRLDPQFGEAVVFLTMSGRPVLFMRSDSFLTANAGSHFAVYARHESGGGYTYQSESGTVEVTSMTENGIVGRFRFSMEDVSVGGPFEAGDITAEGGFNATIIQN